MIDRHQERLGREHSVIMQKQIQEQNSLREMQHRQQLAANFSKKRAELDDQNVPMVVAEEQENEQRRIQKKVE